MKKHILFFLVAASLIDQTAWGMNQKKPGLSEPVNLFDKIDPENARDFYTDEILSFLKNKKTILTLRLVNKEWCALIHYFLEKNPLQMRAFAKMWQKDFPYPNLTIHINGECKHNNLNCPGKCHASMHRFFLDPTQLKKLNNVVELSSLALSKNNVSASRANKIIENIAIYLPKLKRLEICWGRAITDYSSIANLTDLKTLILKECTHTIDSLNAISSGSADLHIFEYIAPLSELNLEAGNVPPQYNFDWGKLAKFRNLKKLFLWRTTITDNQLRTLSSSLLHLNELSLVSCALLSSFAAIGNFRELRSLRLSGVIGSMDGDFREVDFTTICKGLQQLRKLELSNWCNMKKIDPISNLKNLESITIFQCHSFPRGEYRDPKTHEGFSFSPLDKLRNLKTITYPILITPQQEKELAYLKEKGITVFSMAQRWFF